MHPPTSPTDRRHTDPPFLWVCVLAGSLLLNGALTVGLQRYLVQAKPTASTFAPISVDLVSTQSTRRPPTRSAPSKPLTQLARPQSPTAPPTTAPTQPVASAKSSDISLNSANSPTRPKQPAAVKSPAATQAPAQSTAARPASTGSTTQDESFPPDDTTETTTTDLTPQTEDQVATSGIRLPDFTPPPDPSRNPGTSASSATEALTLKKNAAPAKFSMQVQVQDMDSDRASETASVTLISEPFVKSFVSGEAGCVLTPEALQGFNQPLHFTLTLNPKGRVIEAVPSSGGSVNPSYQNLALCTVQTWTYAPVVSVASSTPATMARSLTVKVILTKP